MYKIQQNIICVFELLRQDYYTYTLKVLVLLMYKLNLKLYSFILLWSIMLPWHFIVLKKNQERYTHNVVLR